MSHALITVVIPFDATHTGAVEAFLTACFGNPPKDKIRDALNATGIVHFMSINVVPGKGETSQLLLELSVDGTAKAALEEIAGTAREELRPIRDSLVALFANAKVPGASGDLVAFLARHQVEAGQGWWTSKSRTTGLNYDGSPALTVSRIKREAELAQSIGKLLEQRSGDASALDTLERVRNVVWAEHSVKWAFVAEPAPFLAGEPSTCLCAVPKIAGSAVTTLLWPFALAAAVFAWLPAAYSGQPTLGWTIVLLACAGMGVAVAAYLQHDDTVKCKAALLGLFFLAANVIGVTAAGLAHLGGGVSPANWLADPVNALTLVAPPDSLARWLAVADLVLALAASAAMLLTSASALVRCAMLGGWLILLALVSNSTGLVIVAAALLALAVAVEDRKYGVYAAAGIAFAVVLGLLVHRWNLAAAVWLAIAAIDVLAVGGVLYWLGSTVREALLWVVLATSVPALGFSLEAQRLSAHVAVAMIAIGALLGGAGYAYYRLRRLESNDRPDNQAPSNAHMAAILERENRQAQNHLFVVTPLKPGRLRKFTLRVGLWIIGAVKTFCGRPSFLNGIGSIHFARWVLLPGTDRLVFLSNYDGAWESYLEDFIEKAHLGLTGVWSNTAGFPRASNLFVGGAQDGDRFKHFARSRQLPTLFWYSPYPDLTLSRIRINAAIRQGLSRVSTEAEAADWLSCFGSAPLPATTLETGDIPALVFGGLSPLAHARCLILKLSPSPKNCIDWLAAIAGLITHGDSLPNDSALVVAFSRAGLKKLGIADADLATFPVAFQQGMDDPGRARVLGDVGTNDPGHWRWGNNACPADAVMMLYCKNAARLANDLGARLGQFSRYGHSVVHDIALTPLPPRGQPIREPFGFVDGISQPIVRGTRRWTLAKERYHVIEPGEIILGYPDNRGFVPPSPTVPAGKDCHDALPAVRASPAMEDGACQLFAALDTVTGGGAIAAPPALGSAPQRPRPNFHPVQSSGLRDLGRNGTFLVVRQIDQDVTAFDRFLDAKAASLMGDPRTAHAGGVALREWIGAKMVGRWKDGSSLVRRSHPFVTPPERPDNDFLFGPEDSAGLRCPFGAHIRRANPRDTFSPGSREQLAITNRHRILRVGRRYEKQDGEPGAMPGLLFMCLNADIERQFEFIQQTWLLGPSFNGLENEVDPLVAPRCTAGGTPVPGKLTIPTPDGPVRLDGLAQFMTVRGGGYFFLPGRKAIRFLARLAAGMPPAPGPGPGGPPQPGVSY